MEKRTLNYVTNEKYLTLMKLLNAHCYKKKRDNSSSKPPKKKNEKLY